MPFPMRTFHCTNLQGKEASRRESFELGLMRPEGGQQAMVQIVPRAGKASWIVSRDLETETTS